MQVIKRNSTNILIFTLKEAQTLSSPVFLFELTCKTNAYPYYFIATDLSQYPDRYNKFSVTEGGVENVYNASIVLSSNGEYKYRIFEQTSTTNLNPALCDNTTPLEYGFILVEGTAATERNYDYTKKNGKTYATGK